MWTLMYYRGISYLNPANPFRYILFPMNSHQSFLCFRKLFGSSVNSLEWVVVEHKSVVVALKRIGQQPGWVKPAMESNELLLLCSYAEFEAATSPKPANTHCDNFFSIDVFPQNTHWRIG